MSTNNREIVVKGTGKSSTAPDLIVLNLNLEIKNHDYETVMQLSADALDKIRKAVALAGHEAKNLKTTNFNINTRYDRYKDKYGDYKQRFAGYVSTHGLKLEFDIDMTLLGATLGAITESSVNPNVNIQFSIKDPTVISDSLLESAIDNAKRKATVLAKSAGVKLGEIKRIDYNWSDHHFYSQTYLNNDYLMVCEDVGRPLMKMDVEPEDIDVSDTATITWAIG